MASTSTRTPWRGWRLIAALALMSGLLVAAGPTTVGADTATVVTVSGVVRTAGGAPVSGLEVAFTNSGRSSAVSRPDGSYSLTVQPGQVAYEIVQTSSLSSTDPLPRSVVQSGSLSIAGSRSLDITLPPITEVVVRVQDSNGNPVPGATLRADNSFGVLLGSTSVSLGSGWPVADLTSRPAYPSAADGDGELTVRGFGYSYAGVTVGGVVGGVWRTSAPFTLDSSTSGVVTAVIPVPASTATVSGVVRTADGAPVKGLEVRMTNNGASAAVSGADGSYSLTVQTGQVAYEIAQTSSFSSTDPLPRSLLQYGSLSISGSRTLDITLPPITEVVVRIQDSDGNPVPGATLQSDFPFGYLVGAPSVSLGSGWPVADMTSIPTYLPADGDGELTVRGFGFAYPEVTASGDIGGVRRTSAPFTLDTTTDGSKTVRIGAIEGTVSGVVTTTAGDPVAGTLVAAYLDTDGWLPSVTATTEADGSYAIVAPPGAYRLVFLPPPGDGLLTTWWDGAADRWSGAAVATIPGGTQAGIDQVLGAASSASGRVTAGDGSPIKGVQVWAYLDTDGWLPSVTATTDADGRYTINGPPGAYRFRFLPPAGQGFAATWHQGQLNRFAVTPTVIAAAGAVLGVDQVLPTD